MEFLFSSLTAWHWAILGVIFLVVELMTGSGFLLWLSVGAFLLSIIMIGAPWLIWPLQLFFFSLASLVSIVLWSKYMKNRTEKNDKPNLNIRTNHYIGKTYTLIKAIENGRGRVKIADSSWLVEGIDMPVNTKVTVVDVDGVILKVERLQ